MAGIKGSIGFIIVVACGLPASRSADLPITDAQFVVKAASAGMFEIESSKLAKDMAKSDDVKKLAQMMIDDHEKAAKELKEIATSSNLGVPAKMLDADQAALDKVKNAKGDFDKTYLDVQLKAHEDAVALFKDASKNAQNPKLKAFAEKTLPVLQGHLEHVQKCMKNKDK